MADPSTSSGSGVRPAPGVRLTLPEGVRVDFVARACRAAVLDVLTGIDAGWTRHDWNLWVEGPYARLTTGIADPETAARGQRGSVGRQVHARERPIDEYPFLELLRQAHATTVATLKAAAPPTRDVAFATAAIRKGFVVCAEDETGRTWLGPGRRPRHVARRTPPVARRRGLSDPPPRLRSRLRRASRHPSPREASLRANGVKRGLVGRAPRIKKSS